ncbi:LysR family transcriptional regulator [Glutamicibacter uratoxydans]|uniref:LysR family transcriptional regulator n=1 Tax=Glutamicibacter uratoxydans TaxID=43667 RepID=A0A4Y4DKC3_GLUUR|nr:LysR family transcriptional regulator [Glutamicibacter uratoxydans]GED05416.1 LysR family transcriptional regulator [Glutamicibacter uratoxydans]
MDARSLKYFLAVVDHDGFSRAAQHLLIAQPSLSQTIKSLERELGVPLFHRVGRRSVLSQAGQELVGPARLVLRDLQAAEDAVAGLKGLQRGTLDLVSMPSPAVEPLTTLIARFSQVHPHVAVNTAAAFTAIDVISLVSNGSSEIGLLGTDAPAVVPELDVFPLQRQPLVVVSPANAALTDCPNVTGEQLAGERIIISQRGSLMRAHVDRLIAEGIELEIAVEVAHRSSVLPLVLAGVGHAILPEAWAPMARSAGLHVVELEPAVQLHISLISRRTGLTPVARKFLDAAKKLASDKNL